MLSKRYCEPKSLGRYSIPFTIGGFSSRSAMLVFRCMPFSAYMLKN
jgi:hypothetical protein